MPCGTCVSCRALFAGQHPDFIEIDAASHTGVDNMRLIIESAALLPTLARKKIYLIDEAHMLSKAAFNAALKILEEPPVHVMFILATTDPEKIIETIRSRCFKIFFDPIPFDRLVVHLRRVCSEEKISCDDEGLGFIAQQSGGSVRDALTILERVALAADNVVTGESVSHVVGHIGTSLIMELYGFIKNNMVREVLAFLKRNRYGAYTLWKELTEHIRKDLYFSQSPQEYERTLRYLKISYHTEQLLAKTAMADAIVEYMLVSMCSPEASDSPTKSAQAAVKESPKETAQSVSIPQWNNFVAAIKTVVEPLVFTLFSSAVVTEFDPANGRCKVNFLKEHEIFKEWLDNSALVWNVLLNESFGAPIELDIVFSQIKQPHASVQRTTPVAHKPLPEKVAPIKKPLATHSKVIAEALKIFPGTIEEV
jgi:DNA polymerase-3 subunit gamma/tau